MRFYSKNEKKIIAGLITGPVLLYILATVLGARADTIESSKEQIAHTFTTAIPSYTVTIQSVSVLSSPQVKIPLKAVSQKPKQTSPTQALSGPSSEYLTAQSLIPEPSGSRPKKVKGMPVLYPELVPVCACESSYEGTKYGTPRQFENGQVLRGYSSPEDVGMCQINTNMYTETAQELGYDLYTEAGNISFANWLFEKAGAGPWYKSMSCWSK